jgi:hypothetical protein
MKTICIYASDLAVVIGINKYQKLSDMVVKLWQKNYPEDYENISRNAQTPLSKESDMQCIKRIQSDHGINIQDRIDKCLTIKDTKQLIQNRNEIIKEINKNDTLNNNVKQEFKQSLESLTNKVFGIKNEKSAIQYYCEKTGKNVKTNSKFICKNLCTYKNIKWNLGGKIDGITDDGIVVEIKNRIYKLFGEMKDYEKPQIQSYMYILNSTKGHLVESMKKNDEIDINIIEENFDENYWNDIVLSRLNNFIKLFHLFLENVDLKTYILLGNKDEVENTLKSFLE